ncbi:MAG: DUF2284 domain-containing protein [Acidithiobacillus sp.]|jgi:predicted metal-binding protein|uniref:DUF2284 domain-containing protein n=1 Tax=Acidithiobacillus sp. TaxID=1872118 RepID=UPI00355D934F
MNIIEKFVVESTGKVIVNKNARDWCLLPYPGHPKGCPNYGKKIICPPTVPLITSFFDLNKPSWFVVISFDLKSHMEKMKQKHESWSDRQCKCVLYWQKGANKILKEYALSILKQKQNTRITTCPEAMGVNVILTLRSLSIPIKTKPVDIVYKAIFIGFKK